MEKRFYNIERVPEGAIVIPQPYPYICPHYFTQDSTHPEIIGERGPIEVIVYPRVIRKIPKKGCLDTYIYWSCNKRRVCRANCDFAYAEREIV
jgi:hypothetical protein